MKIDPKALHQLANTYGVSPITTPIDSTVAQCGKSDANYEPVLTGNGYEWSDEANGYIKGNEVIYFFPPKQVFLWVWDKSLIRLLQGTQMLTKWVQGNEKYPEGKVNLFMDKYKQMIGQVGDEESEESGDVSFSGIGDRGEKYIDKPIDPTDAQILMLKKKAGKNNTLPSDLMIKVGLQAKKDGNQKMLDFLKTIQPLGENKIKKGDFTTLIQEIVKGIVEAGNDMWGSPVQIEQPYDEKWVEDWANKIWPDPQDIGRGSVKWKLTKSKRAKTGERTYMLSKTQQVTRNRFLVNRGTKWYYLDEKPDHTKKWIEVPANSVPVPDHNPKDEEEVNEMTTTSGGGGSSAGTPGYNIPGAFGRKMSNRKGHIEVLGYKMTPEGEKEYGKSGDKMY